MAIHRMGLHSCAFWTSLHLFNVFELLLSDFLDFYPKVGITFHGHHNYSPDWDTRKGNPELYSMIDDPQENFNVAGESAYAEVRGDENPRETFFQTSSFLGCRRAESGVASRVERSLAISLIIVMDSFGVE